MTKQLFSAHLAGTVNGQEIELQGEGKIDPMTGETSGTYRLSRIPGDFDPLFLGACIVTGYPNVCAAKPGGFDPLFLGACILTGYPNVCAAKPGVANPFGARPYHYTRRLSFRGGGQLDLKTNCHYEDGQLVSTFELNGDVPHSELCAIEPLIESWEPGSKADIHGGFVIAWQTKDGGLVVAEASSDYYIDGAASPIGQLMHRHIKLDAKYSGGLLTLEQQSALC